MVDIIHELQEYGVQAVVHDPLADSKEAFSHFDVELVDWKEFKDLGALIIAVPHNQYGEISREELEKTLKQGGCIIDVKSMLDVECMEEKVGNYWRL